MQKNYKTNRLLISQIQLADAADLMALFEDEQLRSLSGLNLPVDPQARMMAFQMMSVKPYIYVLHSLTDHELIGVVGFYPCYLANMMPADNDKEIGYALKKELWNQGLMTEACRMLCAAFLLDDRDHVLHANILPRNYRSLGVLKKIGFREMAVPDYLVVDPEQDQKIHFQCGPRSDLGKTYL